MDVSIIIVNYNTKHLLSQCIESLYKLSSGVSFEIIVVDNGSSDGSKSYITNIFNQIKWIDAGENLGFGRANNLGAKIAIGQYLFLLNSDTILLNNAVGIFTSFMNSNKEKNIGAIGSYLLDKNKSHNLSFGKFPTAKSEICYIINKIKKRSCICNISNNLIYEVDYIIGADLFIRKDIFNKINGFDPAFFMYYEEADLQYRMSKIGYKRCIIKGPSIIHLDGGSFDEKGLSYNRFLMSQLSFNYYLKKHFSGLKFLLFRTVLIILRLQLLFRSWSLKNRFYSFYVVLIGKTNN